MDEVHSLMSREKGLAGMAENVRAGFRAGGRAPYGYRLVSIDTGSIRDGEPVTKTRLDIDPEKAPKVAAYLIGRAAGKNARLLAQIEEWEAERTRWSNQYAEAKEAETMAQAMAKVTPKDIKRMLRGIAESIPTLPIDQQREFVHSVIEKVVLDPATRSGSINYRISGSGVTLASPRSCAPTPTLRGVSQFHAPRNRLSAA